MKHSEYIPLYYIILISIVTLTRRVRTGQEFYLLATRDNGTRYENFLVN